MMKLEWVARSFAVIMTILLGVFLSTPETYLIYSWFFWLGVFYSLFLIFKKYTYLWPVGSCYNLIIEAIELNILLFLYGVSGSPLVAILLVTFLIRMVIIYENKIFLPAAISSILFFLIIDFYIVVSNKGVGIVNRLIFWVILFGGVIWILEETSTYIKRSQHALHLLEDAVSLKDTLIEELNESREGLLELNDKLYDWANKDALTGLYNSRYFKRYLDNLFQQFQDVKQNNYPISLIMMDIQGHKIYNDVYGHAAGDLVLQDISKIIKECAEPEDVVIRYSDYVFAIIIPGQQIGEAVQFYQVFKEKIGEYCKDNPGMRNIELSVGWSSCADVTKSTQEELINKAINTMRIID